jgi:hypothetical protein
MTPVEQIKQGYEELRTRGYTQPKLDMFLCRIVGRFGFDRTVAGVLQVQNKRLMTELGLT